MTIKALLLTVGVVSIPFPGLAIALCTPPAPTCPAPCQQRPFCDTETGLWDCGPFVQGWGYQCSTDNPATYGDHCDGNGNCVAGYPVGTVEPMSSLFCGNCNFRNADGTVSYSNNQCVAPGPNGPVCMSLSDNYNAPSIQNVELRGWSRGGLIKMPPFQSDGTGFLQDDEYLRDPLIL